MDQNVQGTYTKVGLVLGMDVKNKGTQKIHCEVDSKSNSNKSDVRHNTTPENTLGKGLGPGASNVHLCAGKHIALRADSSI